jgi:hypothetical protein
MKFGREQNHEEKRWEDKCRHRRISVPKFDLNLHSSAARSTNSKVTTILVVAHPYTYLFLCFLLTIWPCLLFQDFEYKKERESPHVLWPAVEDSYSVPSQSCCHFHTHVHINNKENHCVPLLYETKYVISCVRKHKNKNSCVNIVTCTPIARQHVCKQVPAKADSW